MTDAHTALLLQEFKALSACFDLNPLIQGSEPQKVLWVILQKKVQTARISLW